MTYSIEKSCNLLMDNEVVCVKRQCGKVRYENGYLVENPENSFKIIGNIQPISGKDLVELPEGDRKRDWFWVYTETRLEPNDVVVRKDVEYEVKPVEDWTDFSGFGNLNHFKCRIARIDNQDLEC